MLNKYPAWKNLLILLVVFLGFLYSVPNIYPDDEAIQISADGVSMNDSDMETITTALEAAQVDFLVKKLLMKTYLFVSIQLRINSSLKQRLKTLYQTTISLR